MTIHPIYLLLCLLASTNVNFCFRNPFVFPRSISFLAANKNLPPDVAPRLLEGVTVDHIRLYDVNTLRGKFASVMVRNDVNDGRDDSFNKVLGEEDNFVLTDIVRKYSKEDGQTVTSSDAFVRAGPRSTTHFDPTKTRAAIVTCGGLCPGLNNVIRELVHALFFLYDAHEVIGIIGGFSGFAEGKDREPLKLTLETVADCHHQGGSILASSRGGFDINTIIAFLQREHISQLYVIGGDGTHRGAYKIAEEVVKREMNVAVVGIPKTIDNDIGIIDRSFGFTTSVEAAQAAIQSAKTEARCTLPNGISIVKLMGRSAGFIAMHATLASGDVDLCLVPEVSVELEGDHGCLPFLVRRVAEQGHAVVVLAEEAGEELVGATNQVDASGNKKLPAIAEYLKHKIAEYFKRHSKAATVKLIDPSYMIRSVPANAADAIYCMMLAQNAVHGAMAGYTGFTVGLVNNRFVYIPIPRLVATSPRNINPNGRNWERVRGVTRQPHNPGAIG